MANIIRNVKQLTSGFRCSKWFIAFVVSYAIFVDQFIFTSVIPLAPEMMRQLGVVEKDVSHASSLLLSSCGIAMLVMSPILGWWADRSTSRRPLFLVGLLMLAASTTLLWRTITLWVAYVARVLQGVGSAIVWVMSLAIMFDSVGHARIGEFMGYVNIGMSLGTILGPKAGTLAYARWKFDGVFKMGLYFIAGDFVLRVLMNEKPHHARKSALIANREETIPNDVSSAGTEKTPTRRGKVVTKLRRLPSIITLLYRPRMLCALWGVFTLAVIGDAFKVALPLHAEKTFHWKPGRVADAYIVLAAPTFLGPLFGRIADRIGPRRVAVAGMLLLGTCIILLRIVVKDEDERALWTLLGIIGTATTIILEPLTADIAHVVAKEDATRHHSPKFKNGSYGQGYGLFNTAWSAGNTFGPMFAAHVYANSGWNELWLTLGIATLLAAIPIFLMCGGWWFSKRRKTT